MMKIIEVHRCGLRRRRSFNKGLETEHRLYMVRPPKIKNVKMWLLDCTKDMLWNNVFDKFKLFVAVFQIRASPIRKIRNELLSAEAKLCIMRGF